MNNELFDIRGALYASVTVCDVTFYDLVCNHPVIHFDTLKMSNLEGTAEATDIQGGQGNAVIASINHSKALNLSMEDALVSMSYLAVITGGEVIKSGNGTAIKIVCNEEPEYNEEKGGFVLSHQLPAGTALWIAEVDEMGVISKRLGKYVNDETAIEVLEVPATPTAGLANWLPSTLKIDSKKTYRVFYEYEITDENVAKELTVFSDKFSQSYRMVGDTTLYNRKTGRNEACQIEIPILKLDDNYTLTFDAAGEAATFALNGKALADEKRRLLIIRIYDESGAASEDACDVILEEEFANEGTDNEGTETTKKKPSL